MRAAGAILKRGSSPLLTSGQPRRSRRLERKAKPRLAFGEAGLGGFPVVWLANRCR
jgi:hypothetical protein